MSFDYLQDYINKKMRMSHIYQPVMILSLLERQGSCHQKDVASSILSNDSSQIEYYTKITNDMVGKVLVNNKVVEKKGNTYSLYGYENLTPIEIEKLKLACQRKLVDFLESRGSDIWNHRKKSKGYVPGTIRYEVFKRAKHRCELCGISAEEKALEVDHIIPKNCGGADDITNFQALCYSCNATKRDRDDTDFRKVRESYSIRDENCPFCQIPSGRIVNENALAYAIRDGFPVTKGHTLIIPKRHVKTYFELGQAEINAINELIKKEKNELEQSDKLISGFNIGINCDEDAGQSIFHCHIHLIPRRKGDVESPRGGVRHIIPGKGDYTP